VSLTVGRFEGTAAEWDGFASRQPGFTHFHRFGWHRVIGEAFGHERLYLAARDAHGALTGVLPLVRVRSLLFGHYLVSMPFLNYGGPLGGAEAVRALAAAAAAEAAGSGVRLLELRSRMPLPLDLPVSHRKITVVLDLPADPAALLASFGSKLRSQVRRPAKDGVTVRFGPDQVGPFFEVFSRHMHHLGTPTLPHRFFETVADEFGDSAWFGCAWHEGRPIAGGAGFRWGEEFEMTWAAALVEYNRISPNMAVYWAFMERAIGEGVRLFNFGRCTPDSGTHRFKRQWGSRDEPLWWYQDSAGGAAGATTPSPDQGKYSWGPRLWKRLPLGVSRLLGPHLVKSIP
jgi:FemAB-related protein (PEP-CTERM system-associated)